MARRIPDRLFFSDRVLTQQHRDQLVLLRVDDGTFHEFDAMGAAFWTALQTASSVEGATDLIAGEFSADRETVEQDMETFVLHLIDSGLVLTSPESSGTDEPPLSPDLTDTRSRILRLLCERAIADGVAGDILVCDIDVDDATEKPSGATASYADAGPRVLVADSDGRTTAAVDHLCMLRIGSDDPASVTRCLDAHYDRVSAGGFVVIDNHSVRAVSTAVQGFLASLNARFDVTPLDWDASWFRIPLEA